MKEISISTASKNYSVIVGSDILTVDNCARVLWKRNSTGHRS